MFFVSSAYIFAIGSAGLSYYSTEAPFAGLAILATLAWVSLQTLAAPRKYVTAPYSAYALLWTLFLALPFFLAITGERTHERELWLLTISSPLVFCSGVFLGADKRRNSAIAMGSFAVIAVCSAMNLYELIIEPNVWSTAPGRAAGWFVNPNSSGFSLCFYGSLYLCTRKDSLKKYDIVMLAFLFAGVMATFSRSAVILCFIPLSTLAIPEAGSTKYSKLIVKLAGALVFLGLVTWQALIFAESNLDLSSDAKIRIEWLLGEQTQKDESIVQRESIAQEYWDLAMTSPLTGLGPLTTFEVEEGPHNMYVSVTLDGGVFALASYLILIVTAIWMGLKMTTKRIREGYLMLQFAAFLAVYSFFSHNILTDSATLLGMGLWISLAAQADAYRRHSYATPHSHKPAFYWRKP
ncbi:MAG: O-antigen ligase family protein [Rhodomicrobium sp.]